MIRFSLQVLALFITGQLCAQQQPASFSYKTKDSVLTAISYKYEARSFIHRMIMGTNYRDTWSTPATFAVFHLSKSGLKIEKLGGGEQTKSLRLKDASGKQWVLRTVDKDVTPAVPEKLRKTFVLKIVQDMISASYPYSHPIAGKLSQATNIIAPMPEMYFVADDASLGQYRSLFANTICTLEQFEPTPDGSDTKETEDILEKLREADDLVLQKKFLKIRLMDVLMGDWDRHMDQLRWGSVDSTNITLHYAIPRDRDNAFFYSGGLLPFLAKLTFMPHLRGFTKSSSNIKMLNKKAWSLDRTFLNKLDATAWKEVIELFQQDITDSIIEGTIKSLPPPIVALDGKELTTKLKGRRNDLLKNGMKYYRFLSKQVHVNGSDEEDLFMVSQKDGKLHVAVYQIKKNEPRLKIYERTLDPSETKILHLNGLGGQDRFVLDEPSKLKIKLRVNGNEGKDIYDVKGRMRNNILNREPEDIVRLNTSNTQLN